MATGKIEAICVITALTYKELGSQPFKRKAEQTKKFNDFSLTHHRIEVARQTATPKPRKTGKYEEIVEISLPDCRNHWRHKLVGTLEGNFEELLEAECILTRVRISWVCKHEGPIPLWVLAPGISSGYHVEEARKIISCFFF